MAAEKLLSRLSFYIIAIIILMFLGLLHKNGPWRGFPMPWIFNMRDANIAYFISSLVINATAVVAADVMTCIYIHAKEPKLKIPTKSVKNEETLSETIEIASAEKDADAMPQTQIRQELRRALEGVKEINSEEDSQQKLKQITLKVRDNKSKKREGSPVSGIRIAIAGIILLLTFVLPTFFDNDYDDNYLDWDDDEIVLDAGDEVYTDAESAVLGNAEYLFGLLEDRDDERLSEIFSTLECDEILQYTDWTDLDYEEIETFMSDDESYAVSKYLVSDYDENNHIFAIYTLLNKEEGNYKADTKGLAICRDIIDSEDIEDYYYEELIKKSYLLIPIEKLYGEAKIDNIPILLWHPNKNDYSDESDNEDNNVKITT